jgi:nicotinamidase-related amidase
MEEQTMAAKQQTERTFPIRPRYVRLYTDPGVPLAERNYEHAYLTWELPLKTTALICIDCWSWHFSEETLHRIETISNERITPLLAACRAAGMPVIHMPANPVAEKHANFRRMRPESEKAAAAWPSSPQWPPANFRSKSGPHAQFARPAEPQRRDREEHRATTRDFHTTCMPTAGEPVLLDGEDLHRYCAQEGILHLFFIGFNTNACVMMRDYGLPAMVRRGYHGILVRDCTTGMETAETVADLTCTNGTIADIEQFLGYTVSSKELISALG